jgi:hypothetical protein
VPRLFLACTPRTGNTWFRSSFAHLTGIANLSAYFPGDVPWDGLPADCSLSMHWHRTLAFEGFLRERGFRIMVMARHPLDVLLSILSYAQRDEAGTRSWLYGECGDERPLVGATPVSDAFVRYALSWRAATLFNVSVAWASRAAVHVHYERLVNDPHAEFGRVCAALNMASRVDVDTVLQVHSPAAMRAAVPVHYWQGSPGLWKRLIVPELANAIRERHPAAFETFGYECDPDPNLTSEQAAANWAALRPT